MYLLTFMSFSSIGQKNVVFFSDSTPTFPSILSKILQEQSSDQVLRTVQNVRSQCVEKGFFLCDFQLSTSSNTIDSFRVSLGQQFKGITLHIKEEDQENLQKIFPSNRALLKETQQMSPEKYAHFMQQILAYYLDHGFPFCRLALSNVIFHSDYISAELSLNLGKRFFWTNIYIKNDESISLATLQSIIGIQIQDEYNESILNSIKQRVAQTGVFTLKKSCEVLFTDSGAELFVYLERLKSSSAQGIVGFQPDPISNQIAFTGDLQLKLINTVKHNEAFQFAWKSIQPRTQSMQSSLTIPYLFKSSFGVAGDFQLFKRDSSYLDVKSTIGIQYVFQNGWQLRANYYFVHSSIISETNGNPMFSKLATLKSNGYGLQFYKRQLDYIPNPREGFYFLMEGQLGERKIGNTVSSIWKANTTAQYFLPIGRRMTFLSQLQFDSYHAPTIYQNELFRFGGANSLRGFNEESLFATTKALLTLEYRYLLDKNSAVFVFYNQAYYENTSMSYLKDHPYGFGFGVSAGTNLGIFRLSYALGSQLNNPIKLNSGRIHIAYISYF